VDEEGFRAFVKKKGKSENTIENCVAAARELETYLEKQLSSLDNLLEHDLETFIEEYLDKKRTAKFLWSVSYYFLFMKRDDLLQKAQGVRGQIIKKTRKPFKLKNFMGVQSEHIDQLADLGIKDVAVMMEKGRTPSLRKELAKKSGLDIKVIEEFVRLSDLTRIPGVKGIRARLYYDAGFDSCKKISISTQKEILEVTRKFVEETGFAGIAPLPKEVSGAIETTKKLSDLIEW